MVAIDNRSACWRAGSTNRAYDRMNRISQDVSRRQELKNLPLTRTIRERTPDGNFPGVRAV
jgi:hypothetical protein